ncbi:MAG: carbohydrate kinase [Ruminococcus flavefaciens]|nr:carbohydrate kinase [Ruminococcus flavefaciens]
MIYFIGEILADMTGEIKDGVLGFSVFCGGAPFNAAVAAKRAGASVYFTGRVGNDPVGRYVISEAQKAKLDKLDIQTDGERNTTLAFVTLKDGERDFAFYRKGTADYFIDTDKLGFNGFSAVHLGSLMLSEPEGYKRALGIADKCKAAGAVLSFDVNFRKDLYKDLPSLKRAYAPFIEAADIVKFSEDEITDFTGIENRSAAARSLLKENKLILITLGGDGSEYYYNTLCGKVLVQRVKPVDTTGAGDAFYGTFLAKIENKALNKENIESALFAANAAGAAATSFRGAIKL